MKNYINLHFFKTANLYLIKKKNISIYADFNKFFFGCSTIKNNLNNLFFDKSSNSLLYNFNKKNTWINFNNKLNFLFLAKLSFFFLKKLNLQVKVIKLKKLK